VKEVRVKLGDRVSEGSAIVVLEAEGAAAPRRARPPHRSLPQSAATSAPASAPSGATKPAAPTALGAGPIPGAATYSGKADVDCRMLVLGAGPAATARRSALPTSG
jgi:dihydrolipoamide dehydrogenase